MICTTGYQEKGIRQGPESIQILFHTGAHEKKAKLNISKISLYFLLYSLLKLPQVSSARDCLCAVVSVRGPS